ncbi:hypothetical protein D0Z07_1240 [Hyphodiscus hymeniophilus]|uniref:DNA replication factor Cdt1 C-terminal domain-containing protein n=1 Tax=Hyphodiscus hymeniophilus TaxID=353542 RepID=A0A9P7B0I6_9HELO|nr:hypothetical protein D0Z07_1240 [Hyphodiscus hymeniophilus]
MPGTIKRQKVSATKGVSAVKPLDAFTRVSKPSSFTKTIIDKNNYVETIGTISLKSSTSRSKRKLDDKEEGAFEQVPANLCSSAEEREIKPLPQRRSNNLPETPRKVTTVTAVSADTPTKGARSLLDRLHFSTKTPTRSPLNAGKAAKLERSEELPCELLDLINLHAAFLTALSLHYAHNGTHSPADLRLLCPDVARAWGKRRVLLEDVRRTLGIMNANIPEGKKDLRISKLSLSDYGHGKICVEIRTGAGKAGRLARPVNEDLLNDIYVRGLNNSWEGRSVIDTEVKEFIESLPLEPITTCSSFIKMSPLRAKGQRRLEDMRAGVIMKKEEAAAAKEKLSMGEKSTGTKPTLLERLRAKQLEQAGKAPPPTKAEISRRQALQRIDEVVSVLSILSTSTSVGQTRISFTMPTVLGKLRDSFKTPISKEEGDTCVRLLAAEIAPEWVRIVKMGKVEALAVNREKRPTELEIEERVRRAI